MPVVDLGGFLIAHAPPLFHTLDKLPYRRPNIRMQLFNSKFPGTRSHLTISRLSRETKAALFGWAPQTLWKLPGMDEPIPESFLSIKKVRTKVRAQEQQLGGSSTSPTSTLKDTALPKRRRSRVDKNFTPATTMENVASTSRRESTPWRNIRGNPGSAPTGSEAGTDWATVRKNKILEDKSQGLGPVDLQLQTSSEHVSIRRDLCSGPSLDSIGPGPWDLPGRLPASQRAFSTSGTSSPRASPPSSPRARTPRRERNRVREEAERDAIRRSRHLTQGPAGTSPRTTDAAEAFETVGKTLSCQDLAHGCVTSGKDLCNFACRSCQF